MKFSAPFCLPSTCMIPMRRSRLLLGTDTIQMKPRVSRTHTQNRREYGTIVPPFVPSSQTHFLELRWRRLSGLKATRPTLSSIVGTRMGALAKQSARLMKHLHALEALSRCKGFEHLTPSEMNTLFNHINMTGMMLSSLAASPNLPRYTESLMWLVINIMPVQRHCYRVTVGVGLHLAKVLSLACRLLCAVGAARLANFPHLLGPLASAFSSFRGLCPTKPPSTHKTSRLLYSAEMDCSGAWANVGVLALGPSRVRTLLASELAKAISRAVVPMAIDYSLGVVAIGRYDGSLPPLVGDSCVGLLRLAHSRVLVEALPEVANASATLLDVCAVAGGRVIVDMQRVAGSSADTGAASPLRAMLRRRAVRSVESCAFVSPPASSLLTPSLSNIIRGGAPSPFVDPSILFLLQRSRSTMIAPEMTETIAWALAAQTRFCRDWLRSSFTAVSHYIAHDSFSAAGLLAAPHVVPQLVMILGDRLSQSVLGNAGAWEVLSNYGGVLDYNSAVFCRDDVKQLMSYILTHRGAATLDPWILAEDAVKSGVDADGIMSEAESVAFAQISAFWGNSDVLYNALLGLSTVKLAVGWLRSLQSEIAVGMYPQLLDTLLAVTFMSIRPLLRFLDQFCDRFDPRTEFSESVYRGGLHMFAVLSDFCLVIVSGLRDIANSYDVEHVSRVFFRASIVFCGKKMVSDQSPEGDGVLESISEDEYAEFSDKVPLKIISQSLYVVSAAPVADRDTASLLELPIDQLAQSLVTRSEPSHPLGTPPISALLFTIAACWKMEGEGCSTISLLAPCVIRRIQEVSRSDLDALFLSFPALLDCFLPDPNGDFPLNIVQDILATSKDITSVVQSCWQRVPSALHDDLKVLARPTQSQPQWSTEQSPNPPDALCSFPTARYVVDAILHMTSFLDVILPRLRRQNVYSKALDTFSGLAGSLFELIIPFLRCPGVISGEQLSILHAAAEILASHRITNLPDITLSMRSSVLDRQSFVDSVVSTTQSDWPTTSPPSSSSLREVISENRFLHSLSPSTSEVLCQFEYSDFVVCPSNEDVALEVRADDAEFEKLSNALRDTRIAASNQRRLGLLLPPARYVNDELSMVLCRRFLRYFRQRSRRPKSAAGRSHARQKPKPNRTKSNVNIFNLEDVADDEFDPPIGHQSSGDDCQLLPRSSAVLSDSQDQQEASLAPKEFTSPPLDENIYHHDGSIDEDSFFDGHATTDIREYFQSEARKPKLPRAAHRPRSSDLFSLLDASQEVETAIEAGDYVPHKFLRF